MDSRVIVSIIASEEVIADLLNLDVNGVKSSEPVLLDSPTDVLDSPINPDDIVSGLNLVKVFFETGTAAIAFSAALVKVIRAHKTKVKVINSATNRAGKMLDESSTSDQALEILTK